MIRDIPRLDLHWFADDTAGPACEACNDSGLETQSVLLLYRTGPGMYPIVE